MLLAIHCVSSFKFLWDFKNAITPREWLMLIYNKFPNSFRFSKFSRTISISKKSLVTSPFSKNDISEFYHSHLAHFLTDLILRRPNHPFHVDNRMYQVGSIWNSASFYCQWYHVKSSWTFPVQLMCLPLCHVQFLHAEGAASLFSNCISYLVL